MVFTTSNFNNEHALLSSGIIISAYRFSELPTRHLRLKKVLDILKNESFIEVHDHKGELHIIWRDIYKYLALHKKAETIWQTLGEPIVYHYCGSKNNTIRKAIEGEEVQWI